MWETRRSFSVLLMHFTRGSRKEMLIFCFLCVEIYIRWISISNPFLLSTSTRYINPLFLSYLHKYILYVFCLSPWPGLEYLFYIHVFMSVCLYIWMYIYKYECLKIQIKCNFTLTTIWALVYGLYNITKFLSISWQPNLLKENKRKHQIVNI